MRDNEDELNNLTYIDDDWKICEKFVFVSLILSFREFYQCKTPGLEIGSSSLLASIVIFFCHIAFNETEIK